MSTMSTMRQCDCGAYRLAEKIDGQWRWQGGCRACDTIERLRILLDAGTRVTTRESPSRLRERLERAEREADRLHAKVDEMEGAENRPSVLVASHPPRVFRTLTTSLRTGRGNSSFDWPTSCASKVTPMTSLMLSGKPWKKLRKC